jgi:hypothetical protein
VQQQAVGGHLGQRAQRGLELDDPAGREGDGLDAPAHAVGPAGLGQEEEGGDRRDAGGGRCGEPLQVEGARAADGQQREGVHRPEPGADREHAADRPAQDGQAVARTHPAHRVAQQQEGHQAGRGHAEAGEPVQARRVERVHASPKREI